MVLEAVVVCVDNSDWCRNGDYPPSRMSVQTEAVNYICSMKTQNNEENAVGVLTMAGKRIDVLMTPTRDLGAIMSSVQSIKVGGKSNFLSGLKTAQLCLKNRSNKNQRQRIVMFVASPIEAPSKEFVRLAKQLKKNNVSVDVVNFGSENNANENREILDHFIATVNSSDASHLVNVPPGPHNLSDMVLAAITTDGVHAGMGAQEMVDAAGMDPDLAMAIRMSLEEERQRQEAAAASGAPAAAPSADANVAPMNVDDEEAMIAEAIAMSMQPSENAEPAASTEQPKTGVQETLNDPNFIHSLIQSLPDQDQADLSVEDILNSINNPEEEKQKEKDAKKPT